MKAVTLVINAVNLAIIFHRAALMVNGKDSERKCYVLDVKVCYNVYISNLLTNWLFTKA